MLKRFFAVLAAALLMPFAASAVPITYTYSGLASGNLAGTGFTDASFVITAQADTSTVLPWANATWQNTHASATVSLTGFGTVSFSLPTHTWIQANCCMGFGEDLGANLVTLDGTNGLTNVGYALATNIGPIVAAASTQGQFNAIATSGGALTFSQIGFDVIFQASVVPEASASALMALGLAGIMLATRRRKASTS